jgi:RNA polymerase sigma factor (TIGR02999 family)
MADSPDVTTLLALYREGRRDALEQLVPLVYAELRRVAARALRGERQGHTLQPTALVHEAYVKLLGQQTPWQDRAHFLGCAARIMRNLLVDHARARRAEKRGGAGLTVTLGEGLAIEAARDLDVLALHEALEQLAALDARQARVVELRYFGGLSVEETAEVLDVSQATVYAEWAVARAWLRRRLREAGAR